MNSVEDEKDLLKAVGHRISTPLTDILQIADAITYGAEGEISQSVREGLFKIRSSAEHVLTLAERILDLASVNGLPEDLSSVDILETIHSVYSLMVPQANGQHRQVVLSLPFTLPTVKANCETLQQALQILFADAINISQTRVISISAVVETHFVVVSIQDDSLRHEHQRISISEFLHSVGMADLSLDILFCRRVAEISGGELWLTGDIESTNTAWHISWPIAENVQT